MNDPLEKLKKDSPNKINYRMHVHTDRNLIDALNRLCKEHGVSRSALITELIRDYLISKIGANDET